jgi:ketosteroid isomerase-like protein
MSQENVELVRTIYRLWSSGESAGHLIDADLEYVNPPNAVESGTRKGRAVLGKVREVYPNFRVEPERFVEVGDDVVVIGTARGTAASGLEAQWKQGYVWTVRNKIAIRFRWSTSPRRPSKPSGWRSRRCRRRTWRSRAFSLAVGTSARSIRRRFAPSTTLRLRLRASRLGPEGARLGHDSR